jgi:uncharacterized protein YjbI with pentapeptide repeats
MNEAYDDAAEDLATLLLASTPVWPVEKTSRAIGLRRSAAAERIGRSQMRQGGQRSGLARQAVIRGAALAAAAAFTQGVSAEGPGSKDQVAEKNGIKYKFPPINRGDESARCKFKSSAMGQANAARDELFDLRECKMSGQDASGKDLSGAIMANGDFSKVNFRDAQLSKVFAKDANFDGADFSNGVLDRGLYDGASLKGAIFNNAVLSGSTFEGADLTDTDWSDALLGQQDQKKLCKEKLLKGENPKTGAPTRESAGCISKE